MEVAGTEKQEIETTADLVRLLLTMDQDAPPKVSLDGVRHVWVKHVEVPPSWVTSYCTGIYG